MKFGVIVFPGSNCERDCYYVLRHVLCCNVSYIHYTEYEIHDFDCLILPGGFSYGDYLRAGAIARFSPVTLALQEFAEKGKLILGICNGFQILLEAGLLPGTMMRNKSISFICKWVYVRVESTNSPFTKGFKKGQVLKIPIAHQEGNFFIEKLLLKDLIQREQIAFRYCTAEGIVTEDVNPNGSMYNIAGICNREGNVLGMMPHPERAAESIFGSIDGRTLFESALKYLSG